MQGTLRELMTPNPVILDANATAAEAAQAMRERNVGDVLVQEDGALCGIVTDRDLVVRCLAAAQDPQSQTLRDLCTQELATLEADASIDDAVEQMRSRAVRRLPIVDGAATLGIVSLGDLARSRDPNSALGRISASPATR
ncbi:MAG: CBS domain-containing protein [Myxococcales bacterium]|nr:CBS domain-containing protein [Myxococcales bacterium]